MMIRGLASFRRPETLDSDIPESQDINCISTLCLRSFPVQTAKLNLAEAGRDSERCRHLDWVVRDCAMSIDATPNQRIRGCQHMPRDRHVASLSSFRLPHRPASYSQ